MDLSCIYLAVNTSIFYFWPHQGLTRFLTRVSAFRLPQFQRRNDYTSPKYADSSVASSVGPACRRRHHRLRKCVSRVKNADQILSEKKGRKIRVNVRGTKVQKYLKNVAQSAAIVQLIGNTLQQNMQCVSQEISQKIVKKAHQFFAKFQAKTNSNNSSCVPCSFIVKTYL